MKILGPALIIFIAILSCSAPDELPTFVVGEEFIDSSVRIISIDTFEVSLSTIKFDSLVTSSSQRLLVGKYNDPIFSETVASSYMKFGATTYNIDNEGVLDSIALILGYDNYFYNDTTQVSTINVHKLTEDFRPNSNNLLYNSSTLEYEIFPVISRNFLPEPRDEDSLHISLPITFGQEIFTKIQDNEINNNDELENELEGIVLLPGTQDNSSIIGFSPSFENTYIRFFYSVTNEFGTEEFTYDLTIPASSIENQTYFNSIINNLDGTLLEPIADDQEFNLDSSDSNNNSYIQSGVGIATRVQFPTIKNIFNIPGTGAILNGELRLSPVENSFSDMLPIRDSLSINIIDQNNDIVGELLSPMGPQMGFLVNEDSEFNEDFYSIPVGRYLQQKLDETQFIDDALVLYPSGFNNRVDRVLFSGPENENFQAKLIVTYAIYNEEE